MLACIQKWSPYHALSYVWGDASDMSFVVYKRDFAHHYAQPTRYACERFSHVGPIASCGWDALCINQLRLPREEMNK
jgi:Heterokaryon incompatibility protein (HET)